MYQAETSRSGHVRYRSPALRFSQLEVHLLFSSTPTIAVHGTAPEFFSPSSPVKVLYLPIRF
jgi:hypothetical protein